MSKHYRYQILVRVPGGEPVATDIVCHSLRSVNLWISENETYEGQYTYQKFTGSIPAEVLNRPKLEPAPQTDPLSPSITLLCKLGSIAVHTEEFISEQNHHFDLAAMRSLLEDPEYRAWAEQMGAMAMLPVKRS